MICSSDNKGYSGQAVVIAMIVVAVTAIVGVALVSRLQQDSNSTLSETLSNEALGIADSVVSMFSLIDNDELFTALSKKATLDNTADVRTYKYTISGSSDVADFLTSYLVDNDMEQLFENCDNLDSSIDVTMSMTTEEPVEIPNSTSMGFVVGGNTVEPGCTLNLTFDPLVVSSVGLIVEKIYAKGYSDTTRAVEYKNYDYDDAKEFCIVKEGSTCDGKFVGSAWTTLREGNILNFTDGVVGIPLDEVKDGYRLDEVRITPVGSTLSVTSSLSNSLCAGAMDLWYLKLSVTATCSGVSRGKEVLLPRDNNLTYSTLFDYSIYNSQGLLELFEVE